MRAETKSERRARILATDARPGRILALGMLACLPIAVAFILVPVFSRADPQAALRYTPLVLYGTPLFGVLSVTSYLRGGTARKHRASKLGLLLSVTALLLWALVLAAVLTRA